MDKTRTAKFKLGQVVRHRIFPFRGVVFDIDPEFNNTEEWYEAIPPDVRPRKDQPFYHLFAENAETEYIAYVSEQNLLPDTSGEPIRHPQVAETFVRDDRGGYRPRNSQSELTASNSRRCRPVEPAIAGKSLQFAKKARLAARFRSSLVRLASRYFGGWPPCCCSSFLRASSARFCSSSCSFFCCSSNTFGIDRRALVGLGELGQRQREADGVAGQIDRLDGQHLALLELADQVRRALVVGHAAIGEAGEERAGQRRLLLVDDDAGAVLQLQRARQRDAEDLLRLAIRLDQRRGDDRHAGLGAGVLAGEADLLGVRVLALAAELGPRRIDQLRHLRRRRLRRLRGRLRSRLPARAAAAGWAGRRLAGPAWPAAGCAGRARPWRLSRRRSAANDLRTGRAEANTIGRGHRGKRPARRLAAERDHDRMGHYRILSVAARRGHEPRQRPVRSNVRPCVPAVSTSNTAAK